MGTERTESQRVIRALRAILAAPEQPLEQQIRWLLELGCEALDAAFGAWVQVEGAGTAAVRASWSPAGLAPAPGTRFALAGDGCELALVAGAPVGIERAGPGGLRLCGWPVERLAATALRDGGAGGVLAFGGPPARRPYSEVALDCLDLMSAWLGSELRRRRDVAALEQATRELQQLTRIDPLTQLLNRRGVEDTLRRLADRAGQDQRPTSAVLVDLDDFKRINDDYSHAIGDQVLVAVADRIRGAVRASDRVARIGGDEFLAVLPESSTDQALAVAERIRAAVRAAPVETPVGPVAVSVSIGVAPVEPEHRTVTELLSGVGRRLKASKQAGKDRIST